MALLQMPPTSPGFDVANSGGADSELSCIIGDALTAGANLKNSRVGQLGLGVVLANLRGAVIQAVCHVLLSRGPSEMGRVHTLLVATAVCCVLLLRGGAVYAFAGDAVRSCILAVPTDLRIAASVTAEWPNDAALKRLPGDYVLKERQSWCTRNPSLVSQYNVGIAVALPTDGMHPAKFLRFVSDRLLTAGDAAAFHPSVIFDGRTK